MLQCHHSLHNTILTNLAKSFHMVVKIRLARFGRRHSPFYNIVVAQDRTARNSKPLEVLGTYDPIPKKPAEGEDTGGRKFKDIKLDLARAKYWLGVGAQPSDPAWRLLAMVSVLQNAIQGVYGTIEMGQALSKEHLGSNNMGESCHARSRSNWTNFAL